MGGFFWSRLVKLVKNVHNIWHECYISCKHAIPARHLITRSLSVSITVDVCTNLRHQELHLSFCWMSFLMHIQQKKNQKLQFLIFQLVKYCNRYWGLFSNPSHCNIMSKNSSETVPDCFLSRPSLNISYCQSGPQPTLMTGEAAQGGHTDTHTHKCNHHQWQAMQTHTETQLLCC